MNNIIFLHCVAHRINLTTTDIVDRFPEVKYFQSLIYELVKYFINSPKKIHILDDYQEEILGEALSLIQPIKIRWFSYYQAIKRIKLLLEPIYSALDEIISFDHSFMASNLLNELTNFKTLFYLHFFNDLYSNLDRVSKMFQYKIFDVTSIDRVISISKADLKSNFFTRDDLKNLPSVQSLLAAFNFDKNTFLGEKKIKFQDKLEYILDSCISISKFTYFDLENRFPNTEFFNNLDIFEVKYLTSLNTLKIKNTV